MASAYVLVAGFDPLRDEALAYADRLERAGVHVDRQLEPSLIPGFALMTAVVPAARSATQTLIRRTAARLRGRSRHPQRGRAASGKLVSRRTKKLGTWRGGTVHAGSICAVRDSATSRAICAWRRASVAPMQW